MCLCLLSLLPRMEPHTLWETLENIHPALLLIQPNFWQNELMAVSYLSCQFLSFSSQFYFSVLVAIWCVALWYNWTWLEQHRGPELITARQISKKKCENLFFSLSVNKYLGLWKSRFLRWFGVLIEQAPVPWVILKPGLASPYYSSSQSLFQEKLVLWSASQSKGCEMKWNKMK